MASESVIATQHEDNTEEKVKKKSEEEEDKTASKANSNSAFLSIPGVSDHELGRTSSMPGGIDSIDGPVVLRFQTKGSRKRAQVIRNSIAVTNSDYYNQFRPQVLRRHSQRSAITSTPSALDTISEYEMKAYGRPRPKSSVMSPLVISNENADPNMFQYRSTPILDPVRQTVPTPLSRSNTPTFAAEAKKDDSVVVCRNSSFRASSPTSIRSSDVRPTSVVFEEHPPVAAKIPFSSENEYQFLPLYMNQQSGLMYMFEDGYYSPVPPQQLSVLLEGTKSVVKRQPPAPDRRVKAQPSPTHSRRPRSILIEPPSDYLRFVQVLMVLFLIFLDLPVFLLCSLPALICSIKVRKSNQRGHLIKAKKQSEYVLCFIVLGITFHILTVLGIIMVFLLLHFLGNVF